MALAGTPIIPDADDEAADGPLRGAPPSRKRLDLACAIWLRRNLSRSAFNSSACTTIAYVLPISSCASRTSFA